MYFTGIVIAVSTFLIIGLFHPIVIKAEYHTGTRLWWVFLLLGLAAIVGALFIQNEIVSAIVGVVGASALWSIGELFEQRKRVIKGWFPKNPRRLSDYPSDGQTNFCQPSSEQKQASGHSAEQEETSEPQ